jgi:lipoate-protein ligase A
MIPGGIMKSQEWRFLDLKLSSYARASVYLPTILTLREKGDIPSTLAVISFEKPAVCLFYYNDPDREIDLDFCRHADIEVARRDTGGSPYWADPGTLIFILCFDRREVSGLPETIAEGYRFLIEASARAMSRHFSISASHRPLNDLEVQGKKIAGHTFTFSGNTCRWGAGPQILRPRMELMSRTLKPLPEKFADKEAKTVEARVTNLEALLGYPPSFEEVKKAYRTGLGDRLGVVFRPGELTAGEEEMMAERERRDFSEEWIMAMSERKKFGPVPPGVARGDYAQKVPQGPLIRAVVLLDRGKIWNLSLTGSFHCVPVRIVEEMEMALKGIPAIETEIGKVIHSFFQKPGVQIANAQPEHFVQTMMGALEKAES